MHLGEQRNKIYVFIAIVIFIFWYSTLKRRNHDELELEVQLLQKYSSSADYHSCSTDSCLKLDRCLFDLDRIRVYVQPMVKIKYPNGKELNVQESHEFQQIRQAISNSEYVVDKPEKACLIVPGIDLLNLRKFKSESEVQRAIESISTLLPPNSNLLLFNFVGLRDPIHLKAIWASSSLDQYRLRRKFDVSIPMLRPYNLKLSNDSILDDTALKTSSQQWTAVLRYTSDSVTTQMKEALKSASSNSTLLYLFETKETEKDVTVVKDQEGQQRNYVDVLKHTTFTLIHDLVPGFQMIILDAMECGSIPVIISDEYLPPFHELLDWSRFSILLAKQNLQELPRILNSIQPELIVAMRQSVHSVYWRYLSSPHQVALSTLSLIERRILPVESDGKWSESEISTNKRLWFNVPIRSTASNFTIILAPPQQLDEFEHTIYQLSTSTRQFLHSILVLWPVAERPSNLHSLNLRLQNELSIAIHYLNWNPNDLSSKMSAFVDSIIYRSDASRDCWLFMDLRSQTAELKFTKDLMEQAFGAWKENADSILSFDPFNKQAEIQKQAPFYSGAAFIHPHAAEDIGKSSSKSEQWSRCSKLSSLSIDCKTEAKCPEFMMAQRRLLSIRYLFGVRYQSSSAEPITVKGDNIPEPVDNFDAAGFPEKITNKLKSKYEKPSTIQGISWPIVMGGRDLISVAKTGSGKTLGFILPGIVHSLKAPRRPPGGGPTTLVLAPTRELAQQVNSVALEYAPMMNRNTACVFGGGSRTAQELILKGGIDICIATPGRILDFLAAGSTDLNKCSYLVLDEADRMLDMGFEPQIREVINYIKPERQTLMFSATWPDEVKMLAEDFQRDPVFLNVGSLELSANHNIEQIVELVYEQDKQERLAQLLGTLLKEKDAKILIFVETKSKADGLARAILRVGWKAVCIHGGKSQLQRDTALNEFRIGRYPIMLATDVAARGLDVQDIKAVINYDFPNNIENYVHRIGRTGRQDKKGSAYSFFTSANAHQAKDLVKILDEAGQEIPPQLLQLSERQHFPEFRGFTQHARGSDKYQKEGNSYSKKNQTPRDQRKAFGAYHNKFRHHGY